MRGHRRSAARRSLPPLWVRSTGKVKTTFECGGENSDATLAAAWEAVGRRDAPVLFRGVGAHWPALHSWTLPALRDSLSRGMVRVSPSNLVTFCRESHPDVQSGKLIPPSRNYGHELAWHDGNGHSHLQATLLGPSLSVPVTDGDLPAQAAFL